MATIYDFLLDSLLFDEKLLSEEFRSVSEDRLRRELRSYREFCLGSADVFVEAAVGTPSPLTVMPALASRQLKRLDYLKQGALYLQRQILDDPLFRFAAEPGQMSDTVSEYLGMKREGLVRSELASILRFLKEVAPMYVAGYIRFLPLSSMFEPPAAVPMTISSDQYRERLPPDVLSWMRERARVGAMEMREGKMLGFTATAEIPAPCRMIHVQFDPQDWEQGQFFQLFEQQITSFDEQTRIAEFIMSLPDAPPSPERYSAWVEQSINQAAASIYHSRTFEAGIAGRLGAHYFTGSPFVFDMLRDLEGTEIPEQDRTMREMLELDLPVLQDIDTARLMRVREEEGEAFANFRSELERQLRELELVTDPALRSKKVANISRELTEDQLRAVEREVSGARRKLAANVGVTVAGLIGAFFTGGATVAAATAAVAAAGTGTAAWMDWREVPRKLPGYFLWRARSRS